jgi:hypothetical protein
LIKTKLGNKNKYEMKMLMVAEMGSKKYNKFNVGGELGVEICWILHYRQMGSVKMVSS